MLTREVFMLKKADLDNRMHQSKVDEKRAIHAINESYEERMKDEYKIYRAKRQTLIDERDMKRLEVERQFKTLRRNLWAEDCELVSRWRSQAENTTSNEDQPSGDGQSSQSV